MKARFLAVVLVLGGLLIAIDKGYAGCGTGGGNESPIAVLTVQPEYVAPGRTVILDGSASFDPDGYITKYEWDFGEGEGYEVDNNSIVTHIYSDPCTYTVMLKVTDNDDATDTDTFTVYVGGVFNVTDGTSYDSIQDAINEASENDVIKVYPGRYIVNNIEFSDEKITLTSIDPNDAYVVAETIIDGNNNGRVMTFGAGDANSMVTGFTITNGEADNGGGLYCDGVSPTISNCVITGNYASDYGGGMYCTGSAAPTVTNCLFSGNEGYSLGGGMLNWECSGVAKVTGCIFSRNCTNGKGGGMLNNHSSPEVTNCVFSENTAVSNGGAMCNWDSTSPTITNCTFNKNYSGNRGGGMYNYSSGPDVEPDVTNCIFWDNDSVGDGNEIYNKDASPVFGYCDIAGSGGSDNWDSDFGIDGGGNIDSDPCFADAGEPAGPDGIFATRDDGLFVRTNSPCIDKGSNAAVEESGDIIGNNRIANGDHSGGAIVDMGAYEVPVIWYVDANAPGDGDGSGWGDDAYKDLQDALTNASIKDGNEIWVAEGTYEPTEDSNRAVSFVLIEGVAVYGGFAGGEKSLNDRDWLSKETILSGDIDENGDEDSYHVVKGADKAILDGFTITGGTDEGGMYCEYFISPIISNCVITGNNSPYGGGVYNYSASPTIINCTIIDNIGSGILNDGSSPKIINCAIADNEANEGFYGGGGMSNEGGSPEVTNCVFSGNFGFAGGGMHNEEAYPVVTNCTFSGNDSNGQGGGMHNYESSPIVTNCIFWGNEADIDGNEIYNDDSDPVFGYCDIAGSGGSDSWDTNLGIDIGGNIDADPCFVDANDPNGPDGIFRTFDDGLRLTIDSPCIDAADGDAVPLTGGILGCGYADIKDIDNTGRGEPNCADIGAYEYFPKLVHFTGGIMADKYKSPLGLSKAFVEDRWSDILGPGDYNDTEAAIYDAVYHTLDGIAIHPGLRVIIYSEKDFVGEVLLDKEGPAVINNVHHIDEPDFCMVMGKNWLQPLQSEFPQGVREWSETDMYESEPGKRDYWWGHGSFKIEALYP